MARSNDEVMELLIYMTEHRMGDNRGWLPNKEIMAMARKRGLSDQRVKAKLNTYFNLGIVEKRKDRADWIYAPTYFRFQRTLQDQKEKYRQYLTGESGGKDNSDVTPKRLLDKYEATVTPDRRGANRGGGESKSGSEGLEGVYEEVGGKTEEVDIYLSEGKWYVMDEEAKEVRLGKWLKGKDEGFQFLATYVKDEE